MAAPIKNQPATQSSRWSTVLQHRTPVISERLSKSAGFIDSSQSIQPQWDDFFLGVSPLPAFHIPGKVPGTYRHRLCGLPCIPLPGHTRKIKFSTMMSTYSSRCGSNLSFAGILFFFRFYSGGVLSCSILSSSLPLFLLILSGKRAKRTLLVISRSKKLSQKTTHRILSWLGTFLILI